MLYTIVDAVHAAPLPIAAAFLGVPTTLAALSDMLPRVVTKRRGGIRFIAIGRLRIQVSRARHPVEA